MKTCSAVLSFKSVDEILWCDHSWCGSTFAWYHLFFNIYKMKFGTFAEYWFLAPLKVKGLTKPFDNFIVTSLHGYLLPFTLYLYITVFDEHFNWHLLIIFQRTG